MYIEFCMADDMESFGALGNEADNFQLMYVIKKWLKQNDLAISKIRNTTAGNAVA